MDGASMVNTVEGTAMTPVADPTGVMALSVDEVSHCFGVDTPWTRSPTVVAGCFTTLLGINGAGKTTLFNLITRLYGAPGGFRFVAMTCGDIRGRPWREWARCSKARPSTVP